MTPDKPQSEHRPHGEQQQPQHEAELAGALALANLFSNCVEAFNLIRPQHKWDKDEQLLLARLGIQQARLLIWGDMVGISSPPKTVTDRAIPRHPSSAYPDTTEPTFFAARDARLDEPQARTAVEQALSAIVDRSMQHTREEMMRQYGLAPPKKFSSEFQQALDPTRLEGFREKYALLQEVAESYAQFSSRRSQSIVQTSWVIADHVKFRRFIELTQDKVGSLVRLLGVEEGIDRGMRFDIRSFGWHLTNDRSRMAQDTSKLRLIAEACVSEYPQYVKATEQALEQISRERRENEASWYIASTPPAEPPPPTTRRSSEVNGRDEKHGDKAKRAGLFNRLSKTFGKHKPLQTTDPKRSSSVSSITSEPERAQSDAGPLNSTLPDTHDLSPLEPVRSKSVGAILDGPVNELDDELLKLNLKRISTNATVRELLTDSQPISNTVSRHDQYHGIARTATRDLCQ